MSGPVAAPLAKEGLRPGLDERKCEWVLLPDGKQYLLPVIQRYQKIVPLFSPDGSVKVQVQSPEGELPQLVDGFFDMLATVEDGRITIHTFAAYTSLLKLVRALILFNYDLSDEAMTKLLTMDKRQLETLFNNLVRHIAMSA